MTFKLHEFNRLLVLLLIFNLNTSLSPDDAAKNSNSLLMETSLSRSDDQDDFDVIKYSDYVITIYSEIEAKPCFYFCKSLNY